MKHIEGLIEEGEAFWRITGHAVTLHGPEEPTMTGETRSAPEARNPSVGGRGSVCCTRDALETRCVVVRRVVARGAICTSDLRVVSTAR